MAGIQWVFCKQRQPTKKWHQWESRKLSALSDSDTCEGEQSTLSLLYSATFPFTPQPQRIINSPAAHKLIYLVAGAILGLFKVQGVMQRGQPMICIESMTDRGTLGANQLCPCGPASVYTTARLGVLWECSLSPLCEVLYFAEPLSRYRSVLVHSSCLNHQLGVFLHVSAVGFGLRFGFIKLTSQSASGSSNHFVCKNLPKFIISIHGNNGFVSHWCKM